MEELIVKDINPYLKKSKYIGKGKTAHCYLLEDNSVLKVFKHNWDANVVLKQPLFTDNLDRFIDLTNDTYICPQTIVKCNNKIIGYIYPHITGKNLAKISNNTKLYDLFYNYNQIILDTKKISEQRFSLFDIHSKNIIYDEKIHIIDLDKGYFNDDVDDLDILFLNNINSVFDTIIGRIYNKRMDELLVFNDSNIQKKYMNINKKELESVKEFINYLADYIEIEDPSINDVKRKVKAKNVYNDYYKYYSYKR